MGRWPPRRLHRLRPPRKDLSAIRANRARLLFGDVRSRHSACYQPGTARRRRSRLRGLARGGGKAMCAGANQEPAAGAHGRAAYLGDGAWRRFAVRAWGCGAPDPADVAGRTSGGRGADLSARPGDRGGKRRSPAIARLHKVASYLTAARRDVNVIYIHKGGLVMVLVEKLDELGKPAWIALMILGFIVWWPLGLVTLAFILGSGRMAMGCWGHHNDGSRWQHNMSRWQSKMERMQEKMDRLRGRME